MTISCWWRIQLTHVFFNYHAESMGASRAPPDTETNPTVMPSAPAPHSKFDPIPNNFANPSMQTVKFFKLILYLCIMEWDGKS